MAFNSNYCFSGIIMITSIGFFTFLIGQNDIGAITTVGPSSTYVHAFFIALVSAVGFSFFSNISLAESKLSEVLALQSGIILILGMLYVLYLIPSINDVNLPWWFANSTWIFSALGIMLLTIGYFNLRMGQIYSIKTTRAIEKKERIC
jgi:hypothetical protein